MERYSNRKFDETGRIILPIELRKRLSLEIGSIVALYPVRDMAILKTTDYENAEECLTSKVDELGMIALSDKLKQKLGWQPRSDIAIYYTDDETAILKRV